MKDKFNGLKFIQLTDDKMPFSRGNHHKRDVLQAFTEPDNRLKALSDEKHIKAIH